MLYARTLRSDWYMGQVCDSIYASLEGAKQWTKLYYESDTERNAYVDMFEQCQTLVQKHDLKPDDMLKALSDLHTHITSYETIEPFFSVARWFYNRDKVREEAVVAAFQLVDSIKQRYVWC